MTDLLTKRYEAFLGELLEGYAEGYHSDIDGASFQEMLEKHGFISPKKITAELCEEPWAQEYDYEPGDTYYAYSDDMQRLMRKHAQRRAERLKK